LLNTNTVAFSSSENALLSLMSIMFNLQSKPDLSEFKIRQFLASYKLFFPSTFIYESFSIATRLKAFEKVHSIIGENNYLNGFFVGAGV
jgi:hypothetical protein